MHPLQRWVSKCLHRPTPTTPHAATTPRDPENLLSPRRTQPFKRRACDECGAAASRQLGAVCCEPRAASAPDSGSSHAGIDCVPAHARPLLRLCGNLPLRALRPLRSLESRLQVGQRHARRPPAKDGAHAAALIRAIRSARLPLRARVPACLLHTSTSPSRSRRRSAFSLFPSRSYAVLVRCGSIGARAAHTAWRAQQARAQCRASWLLARCLSHRQIRLWLRRQQQHIKQ